MLVLSRKAGQLIQIGDDISIEIRRIAGNRVTIALSAPRDVRILRGELEAAAKEFDDHDHTSDTYHIAHHRMAVTHASPAGSEMVG